VRAPQERHVQQPGEGEIVGVAPLAHEERAVFAPPHAAADVGRVRAVLIFAPAHRGHRGMLA